MNYTKNDGRGNVEGFFLVAACSVKMTKKAQPYLDMVLCDPTGEKGQRLAIQRQRSAQDRAHTPHK